MYTKPVYCTDVHKTSLLYRRGMYRGQTLQMRGMYRGQTLQVRRMYRYYTHKTSTCIHRECTGDRHYTQTTLLYRYTNHFTVQVHKPLYCTGTHQTSLQYMYTQEMYRDGT